MTCGTLSYEKSTVELPERSDLLFRARTKENQGLSEFQPRRIWDPAGQQIDEFPRCWEHSGICLVWQKPIVILRRSLSHAVRASVAQLAELRFCKPVVVGSSPSASFSE